MRREALDALFRIYRASNDLPSLYRIAQRLHENSPNEPALAANYARLALHVNQNPADGHRLAKETYDRAPDDVNVASVVTHGPGNAPSEYVAPWPVPSGVTSVTDAPSPAGSIVHAGTPFGSECA